jgi:hypothetical protein
LEWGPLKGALLRYVPDLTQTFDTTENFPAYKSRKGVEKSFMTTLTPALAVIWCSLVCSSRVYLGMHSIAVSYVQCENNIFRVKISFLMYFKDHYIIVFKFLYNKKSKNVRIVYKWQTAASKLTKRMNSFKS